MNIKREQRRAKRSKRNHELLSRMNTGEPKWTPPAKKVDVDKTLAPIFNWYSYHKDSTAAIKYVQNYLTQQGEDQELIDSFAKFPVLEIPNTAGWIARMILVGAEKLPKKCYEHLEKWVQYGKQKFAEKKAIKVQESTKSKLTVQDYIEKAAASINAEIAGEVDAFITENKFKSDFSLKNLLKSKESKAVVAKKVQDYVEHDKKEIEEVLAGKDEQLVEAYSCFTKKQLKKWNEFLGRLINEAAEWKDTAAQLSQLTRKPRKRKEKPASYVVRKIKYLKEYGMYSSINPEQIIGAKLLIVYNTKYRRLGVYHCPNEHGFTMKGTTIKNFEIGKSIEKKLRKPDDILGKINAELGKVAARNLLKDIRAKERKLTGRINKDVLILYAD